MINSIEWNFNNESIILYANGDTTAIGKIANELYQATNKIIRKTKIDDNYENRYKLYMMASEILSKKTGISIIKTKKINI